jgi:hypothetical protein
MVINRHQLGCILVAGVLTSVAVNALAYQATVCLLCPPPGVTLECFDVLREGMSRDQVLGIISPEWTAPAFRGPEPDDWRGHRVQTFKGQLVDISLETDDGSVITGTAVASGQVVCKHLQPAEPILDPIRLNLLQLEARRGPHRPFETLCFAGGLIGLSGLVTLLCLSMRRPSASPEATV